MARPRYNGSIEDLHAAIDPYVTSTGWFQYQEAFGEPIKPDILVAHKDLLRTLTDVCPNLSFSKSQLTSVLKRLLEEKAFEELEEPAAKKHWIQTYIKRLQVACRHMSQSRLRKPPPKWLAFIDDGGDTFMSEMTGLPESFEDSLGDGDAAQQVGSPVHPGAQDDARLPATQDPMT
jgi:hypothetical protein